MSILLYESYNPKKQAFDRLKDAESSLVITLAAGKGVILDAFAYETVNFTEITKAYPGQSIGIDITLRNDGDNDVIWVTAKDMATGSIITTKNGTKLDFEWTIDRGKTQHMNLGTTSDPIIMPNKLFNIHIEAGHGK